VVACTPLFGPGSVGTLSQSFPLLVLQGTPTPTLVVRWGAYSSHAGDQADASQTATAKEPEHHRVERVELGVDRLAMHPRRGRSVRQAATRAAKVVSRRSDRGSDPGETGLVRST
jgi:hypothetical protein